MLSNGESMIICKKCGTENKNGDSFCKGCGDNLLQQNIDEALPLPQDDSIAVCQKCGTKSQIGDSFCRGCGGSLVENKNAENISKEKANKKVWLSIVAVAVGVLLIAIVLKISNNSDYTTEAVPAAMEEAMPAAEISYREAMPITINNFYDLNGRVTQAANNLVSSASEVEKMKAAIRDPIEAMGYDFDKTLLSVSKLNSIDEASLGFTMLFMEVKLTVLKYPDESVAKGFVSEETKNIIVGARDAALQKSKEQVDAAALKSAWESVPASNDQKVKGSSEEAQKAEATVNTWSEAHNTRDLDSFSQVFASRVKFYGKELAANKIIDEKIRVLEKYPNFHQEIIGDITCNVENQPSAYRCEFTKRVTFGKREKDYPSYLVIDTSTQEPKVIVESDHITDRNLK
jgi:hypothetical protein